MVFKVCRPKTGDAKGGVASNGNSVAKIAKLVLVVASLCGWRCSLAVGFVLKYFRRGSSILVTVSWKTEVYQRFWGDFCWSVWILRKVHKNHGFGVWAKSRFPGLPHQFYCEGFQVKIRYTLNFFLMKWHFCKDDHTKNPCHGTIQEITSRKFIPPLIPPRRLPSDAFVDVLASELSPSTFPVELQQLHEEAAIAAGAVRFGGVAEGGAKLCFFLGETGNLDLVVWCPLIFLFIKNKPDMKSWHWHFAFGKRGWLDQFSASRSGSLFQNQGRWRSKLYSYFFGCGCVWESERNCFGVAKIP